MLPASSRANAARSAAEANRTSPSIANVEARLPALVSAAAGSSIAAMSSTDTNLFLDKIFCQEPVRAALGGAWPAGIPPPRARSPPAQDPVAHLPVAPDAARDQLRPGQSAEALQLGPH